MPPTISPDSPVYAVPDANLVPVSDYLSHTFSIPPSRMFLINKSLKVFKEKFPDRPVFDASQGDGGASLPGVPRSILERAAQMQIEHGSAYDMPYGTDEYRKVDGRWKIARTGYKRTYEEVQARADVAGLRLTASWWSTDGVSELDAS